MAREDHTQLDDSLDADASASAVALDPTQYRGAEERPAADERPAAVPTASGEKLGRYVVLDRIGAGGMGVVYTAWDPQLDRRVALKLLLASPSADASDGRARIVREAQAMAQLVHPNVVAIYDVGLDEAGRVFIAMEFVDGVSLEAWLGEATRSWTEILACFRAAGRGLEAAHAAGLIHRDFKPDNVMIGKDGRPRVLDFGLARRGDDVLESSPRRPISAAAGSSGVTTQEDSLGSLTRTGVLIGTPAYMSPEQFKGGPLDARSDQFSFCVALWRALTGERPFEARNRFELVAAVCEGELQPFANSEVPKPVVAALERGLAPDPEQRWPDMGSLLAALEPPAPAGRRGWLALSLGALATALVLGLGFGFGLFGDDQGGPAVSCEVGEDRLAGVWDADRSAALGAAFEATQLPWASAAADRVRAELDLWAVNWRRAVEAACVAHHQRHELSAELFDLRMACLDRRLRSLDSLVGLLSDEPDAEVVEQAMAATLALDSVEACSDPDRLRAAAPSEDSALAARVGELEAALTRREQLQDLGKHRAALDAGEALRPELEAVDDANLWAKYWLLRALDLLNLGELDEALEAASKGAVHGRSARVELEVEALLVITRTTLMAGRHGESERWLALAEGVGEGVEDPWLRYELVKARGFLHRARGELGEALVDFERALELARESFGEDSYQVATELSNYGDVAATLAGERPELGGPALEAQRRSHEIMDRTFAADHPTAIKIHINLVEALLRDGRGEQALAELDRVDANLAQTYARDHALRRTALLHRARTLEMLERCEEAFAEFDAYLDWVEAHRSGDPGARIIARVIAAQTCGRGHPRARELLDEAVELALADGELGSTAEHFAVLTRAFARFEAGELDGAAADLDGLRAALAEPGAPQANPQLEERVALLADLLEFEAAPERPELRARLLAGRERLDPLFQRQLVELVDRRLARGEAAGGGE